MIDLPSNERMQSEEIRSPIRVGALVDLQLKPTAGGHVKCWQHFAEAATRLPDELDLTVHFEGEADEIRRLSENVRYEILPPGLSSDKLPLPIKQQDHTDLAFVHHQLLKELEHYDVIHATGAWFAYARTAMRYHKRSGIPLVISTHTNVPRYARMVARNTLRDWLGESFAGRWLIDRWHFPRWIEQHLEGRLDRFLESCDFLLASSEEDYERGLKRLPPDRVRRLRRGIDKEFFHPKHRNRPGVAEEFHLPEDKPWLLFVGRLEAAKRPVVLAKAARALIQQGKPLHVIFVGTGPEQPKLEKILGQAASFPGSLPQDKLQGLYASSDLFVFPSSSEVMPNVVIEAKTSGLPVILSAHGGSGQMVRADREDGLTLKSSKPRDWAEAIRWLLEDESARLRLGKAARQQMESSWPSWDDVLREDLLPVWKQAAREGRKAKSQSAGTR